MKNIPDWNKIADLAESISNNAVAIWSVAEDPESDKAALKATRSHSNAIRRYLDKLEKALHDAT